MENAAGNWNRRQPFAPEYSAFGVALMTTVSGTESVRTTSSPADEQPYIDSNSATVTLVNAPIARLRLFKAVVWAIVLVTFTQLIIFGVLIGLTAIAMRSESQYVRDYGITLGYVLAVAAMFWPLVLGLLSHLRNLRRVRRALAELSGAPIDVVLDRIAPFVRQVRKLPEIRKLARELARAGWRGLALRFAPADQLEPFLPLNVPIEPMVVAERDANFRALAAGETPAAVVSTAQAVDDVHFAWLPRHWLARCGVFVGAYALMIATGAAAVEAMRKGPFWAGFVLMAMCVVAGLALPFGTIVLVEPRQWLIVNGGLIVRRRGRLRYYRARESVLEIEANSPNGAFVSVSDGLTWDVRTMSRREWETSLRAWLSPLPPPDLAKLSDLA